MVKIQESPDLLASSLGGSVELAAEHEKQDMIEENQRAREKEIDLDLVDQLRALMSAEYEANSDKYAPIHYEEIMNPNSAFTCWRYLAERSSKVEEAFELMKQSLAWRKENGVDELDRSGLIKEFWHFTPIPMCGHTREGNQLLYVLGKHYRKPHGKLKPYIPKFCGNNLFSWDREHDLDLMKLHVIFDVTDTGYRNIDLDFMTWLISIKDYLPGRWHQFSVVGIPFIIRPLIHLVLSWLPDSYRQITYLGNFDKLVREVVEEENLPVEVGGSCDERRYKLAPAEAPWASESAVFRSDEMLRYVEECILMTDAKRAQMRELQIEYENKLSKQQS